MYVIAMPHMQAHIRARKFNRDDGKSFIITDLTLRAVMLRLYSPHRICGIMVNNLISSHLTPELVKIDVWIMGERMNK